MPTSSSRMKRYHLLSERNRVASGFCFIIRFSKLICQSLRHEWTVAILLAICLLTCGAFYEYVAYQIGLIASGFYNALTKKSYMRFIYIMQLSILYVAAMSLVIAVKEMVAGHLAIVLRSALTTRLQKHYFQFKRYYTITSLMDIDNPDQRFTQDVGTVCTLLSTIVPTLLINPILVIFYTYKCVEKAGWLGPVAAYILFIVFYTLTRLITNWTSAAIYEQDRQEGNFRFVHTQLRCSSESAAFLNAGPSEQYFTRTAFEHLLHVSCVNVNRRAVLKFITTMSAYVGAILNYLTLGIVLFNGLFGDMDSSAIAVLISQTSFFLLYLINKLTTLVDLTNPIAQLVGVGLRILTLNDGLNECLSHQHPASYMAYNSLDLAIVLPHPYIPAECPGVNTLSENTFVQLQHVSVAVPPGMGRMLICDLNLTIQVDEPLLISGPSGTGKTALLRVLADLWPAVAADQSRPEVSYFYRSARFTHLYVPQQAFVPSNGSCPSELFQLVDLSDTEPMSLNPHARALHLAYLLLTLSDAPVPPQIENSSYINKNHESSSEKFLPTATVRDLHARGVSEQTLVGAEQQPVLWFCGYPTDAYHKALRLLVEFRLVDSLAADHLHDRLRGIQHKPVKNRVVCWCSDWWNYIRSLARAGCQLVSRHSNIEPTEKWTCYSPGEMQRLLLASICFQCPDVAFLDEATSQLSAVDQAQAYESLRSRKITPVTVAHQESLRKYHSVELQLFPSSNFAVTDDVLTKVPRPEDTEQPWWKLTRCL